MRIDVMFEELGHTFNLDFGRVQTASDGGYERGYEEGYGRGESAGYKSGYAEGESAGYSKGYDEGEGAGYAKGHADGLAERTYETWTLTMTDGSVVEKEVALL